MEYTTIYGNIRRRLNIRLKQATTTNQLQTIANVHKRPQTTNKGPQTTNKRTKTTSKQLQMAKPGRQTQI